MKRTLVLTSLVLCALPASAGWLSGPAEVAVRLEHPPALRMTVNRVAFGAAEGQCADELVDALIATFVNQGVEVIDRLHLQALLAEHEFSVSGLVDRASVAELGKILGPTALIFVNSRRCTTEQQRLTDQRNILLVGKTLVFTSRTTAYFKGSVQVIDLGTARIHSARAIDEQVKLENQARGGQPEFPSTYEAVDRVLQLAAHRVHQLFFPWTEQRTLRFYDADECNLKLAYNLVQAGDYEAALEQSKQNATECDRYRSTKPRLSARARYNLGMAHFLVGDHDTALDELEESLRIRPDETTSAAMAECRRAKQTAEQMAKYEEAQELDTVAGLRITPQGEANTTAPADDHATSDEQADTLSIEERLHTLDELLKKGFITKAEYDIKRKEILAAL